MRCRRGRREEPKMADQVKARMTAAKIGVGLAFAGLLAGLVSRVRSEPARLDASRAASQSIELRALKDKLTSAQIKDHSLLYRDFKRHQVASFPQLKKVVAELADSKHKDEIEVLSLTALTAEVRNQVIQGHGGVFSGMQDVGTGGASKDLLSVPGWITVQGLYVTVPGAGYVPAIRLVNLASYAIVVNWSDGQSEHQDTLAAGSGSQLDLRFKTGNDLITAQLLSGDGRPITLTL